jgi:hypothetical protein
MRKMMVELGDQSAKELSSTIVAFSTTTSFAKSAPTPFVDNIRARRVSF